MDWRIFDIIVHDEKMVNLVTTFGYPFPRTGNILALKSYDEESTLQLDDTKKAGIWNVQEDDMEDGHGTRLAEGVVKGESETSRAPHEDGDVVKVYLEPHEGQEANTSCPFHILPKQMVSPVSKICIAWPLLYWDASFLYCTVMCTTWNCAL